MDESKFVPKKSWMREDKTSDVQAMLREARKREDMKRNMARYKIYADLLAGKTADITADPGIFAAVNQERIALKEYMGFFPEQCRETMAEVKRRRSADDRDYNPNSKAKWRIQGLMPSCVHELFMKVYPGSDDRNRAIKRFFNEHEAFRISGKRI